MDQKNAISTQEIRTIEELVDSLQNGAGSEGYVSILDRVAIPADAFTEHCTWNQKHYTRNCIVRTEDFELLVICYEPGQSTSIHDYSTEEAWVHGIMGSLVEERFQAPSGGSLRKVSSAKLDVGSFSYLHNGRSIHRYINNTTERAVSLNLYARPLRQWKVYDERSGEQHYGTPQ